MKERGGLATTIALVLAVVLGGSYLPRKSGDTTTATEGQRTPVRAVSTHAKSQQASSKIEPLTSCQQIATRLRRFYGTDIVPDSVEAGCYGKGVQGPAFSLPANSSVVFAIAIVPNPVQTHLPLLFDRAIEAIQQAAQDTNYSYDGSWFPWNQSQKSYESLTDEEQSAQFEAELQEQPGIMVFRSGVNQPKEPYEGGLAIFVVAEQPTGGISDAQFEHALQWMSAFQSTPSSHKLRIIGPTFSGSLSSLERELENQNAFLNYPNGIEIFSGATNAEENVRWFEKTLRPEDEFRTFLQSDSLMTDRFLCYLQHEGYDLNHVAILSEDQTAFGKAKVSKDQKGGGPGEPRCQDHRNRYEGTPVYLYYPRDIATLRSAYEQQAIFSASKPQANAPATSLKQDLSEPASSQHDTVRTYGGQLTPLAQEAELFGIANILDTHHIEFVILRSSNSIDQLFLSEFLRRSYPSGRVVIDGADLLFRRGMQGASLRGVILLSPYPLLSWTHGEIPTLETEPTTSYRVFPQDLSEGVYIAARELLKDLQGAGPKVPISDYAPPQWALSESGKQGSANQRPATWVTVVGHRQFWPLAVLNEQTEVESDPPQTPYGPAGHSLLKPEAG